MILKGNEKEKIINGIRETLAGDDEIIFVYLSGSFIGGSSFKDIDIFVYLGKSQDPFACSVRLRERLADTFSGTEFNRFALDDFDVRIINGAPCDILMDILRNGRLLVDNDPDFRTDVIERVSDEYRVNCSILDEARR